MVVQIPAVISCSLQASRPLQTSRLIELNTRGEPCSSQGAKRSNRGLITTLWLSIQAAWSHTLAAAESALPRGTAYRSLPASLLWIQKAISGGLAVDLDTLSRDEQ